MLRLRKLFLGLAVLVTFALGSLQAAHADQFTFDYRTNNTANNGNNSFDLTGTLFATNNNDGSFTVNSGSIFIGTNSAGFQTGTYALLPTGNFGSDNLIFPTASPVVDTSGLAFGTGTGLTDYQISLAASAPSYFAIDTNNNGVAGTLTISTAPVPEISTGLSFGSIVALGGLSLLRRRKAVCKAI